MYKVDRVEKSLIKDRDILTAKQIGARFGLKNPRDAIMKIRRRGYVIALKYYVNAHNDLKRKYGYTTAVEDTRDLIAAAYRNKAV